MKPVYYRLARVLLYGHQPRKERVKELEAEREEILDMAAYKASKSMAKVTNQQKENVSTVEEAILDTERAIRHVDRCIEGENKLLRMVEDQLQNCQNGEFEYIKGVFFERMKMPELKKSLGIDDREARKRAKMARENVLTPLAEIIKQEYGQN